jgi:hypothetical protein
MLEQLKQHDKQNIVVYNNLSEVDSEQKKQLVKRSKYFNV